MASGLVLVLLGLASVGPVDPALAQAEVMIDEVVVDEATVELSPREYLYAIAPVGIVARLDCIANHESGWDPGAKNRRSSASGIFQFLDTTWASTPEGRQGASVFEPYANVRMGLWLYEVYGPTQWQVFTQGYCK